MCWIPSRGLSDTGWHVQEKTYILFSNGLRMWGRWYYILYLEFHKIGQWTFAQHRSWEFQFFPKLHDMYVVVTTDKLLTIHMASHNIPATTTRKRTSLTMICLFCVHLELQQNMKHPIYRDTTGYQMVCSCSLQIIIIYSFSCQNKISELLWHRVLQGWCE